jgi:PilZ domain-containing protein
MKQKPQETGKRHRLSERVLLRIPIEVRGEGAKGRPFSERTFTLVINRHGAQINLKNSVQPGDQVSITNLQNNIACPFRVVAKATQALGEGPEWGVECLEPEVDFWGISFPGKEAGPREPELIDALLECSSCHFRELAQLTMEQYRTLINQSPLSRDCSKCKARTEWGFGFVEAEPEEAPAAEEVTAAPSGKREKRREPRFTVKLPTRIRRQDGKEEVTSTENLSEFGVCFVSALIMEEGERISMILAGAPGRGQKKAAGRVVWRRLLEGTKKAIYGVELEEGG